MLLRRARTQCSFAKSRAARNMIKFAVVLGCAAVLVVFACTSVGLPLHHEDPFHALRSLHYRIPDDFGIQHHQILGSTSEGVPGILHIIVKAVRKEDGTVAVWGTGVFEALESGSTYRSHASFEKQPPKITLEGQQTYTSWPVTVKFPENHPGVPFHVQAEFQDSSSSYALKVEGWPRFAMVRPRIAEEFLSPIDPSIAGAPKYTVNASTQGFDRSMAPVVGIISPMHVNKQFHFDEFPSLVAHHMQYHLRIGYSLFVMYVRPSLEVAMANNTHIKDLVRRNRLVLVSWNEMPHHADHPYFDQELVYNHAATVFWGHNVWFSTIDVDEYMAADEVLRSVRHVIFDCPKDDKGQPVTSDLVRMVRWQMDCPECRSQWDGMNSGDIMYWATRRVPDPLKLYSRAGPYDPPQASKYFLNPNAAASITPHMADLLPGALPMVMVEPSCAYIAHLVNLIHPRHIKEAEYFDKPNTWWWLKSDTSLHYSR